MKSTDADIRRALARLGRALEKARRELRGLHDMLEDSEAEGFPGEDYAEMEELLRRTVAMVHREQARQQAKILRAGGISPGRLGALGPRRMRVGGGSGGSITGGGTDG